MNSVTMKLKLIALTLFFITSFVQAADSKPLSPMSVEGATTVDSVQAKALFDDGALFVDVRSDKDWNAGRISDALHLELKAIFSEQTLLSETAKGDNIVIYCNGEQCLRSSVASEKAVSWGFSNVFYYRDGYPAWKNAKYSVE